ncbi:hypothetical protein DFH06DRAFT_1300818 [Mycena polygramma]|nr:hypothetical protein DFH06DRAFT_1300818 [Mycena polygramma]
MTMHDAAKVSGLRIDISPQDANPLQDSRRQTGMQRNIATEGWQACKGLGKMGINSIAEAQRACEQKKNANRAVQKHEDRTHRLLVQHGAAEVQRTCKQKCPLRGQHGAAEVQRTCDQKCPLRGQHGAAEVQRTCEQKMPTTGTAWCRRGPADMRTEMPTTGTAWCRRGPADMRTEMPTTGTAWRRRGPADMRTENAHYGDSMVPQREFALTQSKNYASEETVELEIWPVAKETVREPGAAKPFPPV